MIKNKVLLITSSFEEVSLILTKKDDSKGVKTDDSSHYPLGLAYLHSYLESQKIKVKSLFLNNHPFDKCIQKTIEELQNFSPEIVGIQMLTANRISSYKIIEYIHENHKNTKIIVGGIHSTIMYEQLLKKYPYIIIVLGEGELTLSELAKKLNKPKTDLNKIKGIAFSKKGKIIRTIPRELIEDLDQIPFPKHELFFNNSKRDSACILSSRGCAFKCSFCCINPLNKRRVRFRSTKNVVDEIEYLTKKFPQIKEIWFHDDSLFIDNQRVIEICKEIIKRKIKNNFVASGRIKPLSEEMLKWLEKANFNRVLLGLESGDNDILKKANKGINQEDVLHAFKLFSKSKISIKPFIIIGLPGETKNTILNTIKFIKKLQKIKYASYSDAAIITIYPGTDVYEIAKSKGIINDDFWLSEKPIPLYTAENSLKELYEFKELFLNNLSAFRIFTIKGFLNQTDILYYTLKYALWTKRRTLLKQIKNKIRQI